MFREVIFTAKGAKFFAKYTKEIFSLRSLRVFSLCSLRLIFFLQYLSH